VDVKGTRLTVGYVAGEASAFSHPQGVHRRLAASVDYRVYLLTPAAARDVVVLLAEPPTCAQQCALDHGHAHFRAGGDLRISEPFQFSQHHDRVLPCGEAAECAVQGGELLATLKAGIRTGRGRK
jgi:hypothetical protein